MKKAKLAIIFLALLMLCPIFASCKTNTGNDTTKSVHSTSPVNSDETDPLTADELGEYNFKGKTFTTLTRKETSYEFNADTIQGDTVNDAVYKRNNTVSERFDVEFDFIERLGHWDDRAAFISFVTHSLAAGDEEFQLVSTHSAYLMNIALQGNGYDLNSIPNINLAKKWWAPSHTKSAAIDDEVYLAVGDILVTLYEYMDCVYFNKKLVTDFGVEDNLCRQQS